MPGWRIPRCPCPWPSSADSANTCRAQPRASFNLLIKKTLIAFTTMDKSADEDGDGAADVDGAEFGSDGSNGEDSDDDSGDTDDGSSDDDGDGQSTVNFSICVCPLLANGGRGGGHLPALVLRWGLHVQVGTSSSAAAVLAALTVLPSRQLLQTFPFCNSCSEGRPWVRGVPRGKRARPARRPPHQLHREREPVGPGVPDSRPQAIFTRGAAFPGL